MNDFLEYILYLASFLLIGLGIGAFMYGVATGGAPAFIVGLITFAYLIFK